MNSNKDPNDLPTWRLWGEEREKDAIYTVYLKKVRYHRPTPSSCRDESQDEDEISHICWETVRIRFVKAATLPRLVENLITDDGELESTFVNVFLATYRTFTKTEKVVELLLQKYEKLQQDSISETDKHRKTLVHLLHLWLDVYPEDWDISNLENLIVFSSKNLPNSELHLKALTRLDQLTSTRGPITSQWFPYHPLYDFTSPSSSSNDQLLADQFNDICLNPAFRGPGGHLLNTYRFPNINVKHFAEQLTRMDMILFKRLIPHQCLGSTWSKRENDKAECRTVLATVDQFNAVSFRVISSILIETKLKPQERALLIQTWVDIAQELRLLKNFSSLKAIVSGLQSNPVYRLNKTWAALQKEKAELFNELARIFSEENNASTQREILMREGTAKYATSGENDRHLQKAIQKQNTFTTPIGTIPYLGTFLTDLTYIHAAIPNTTADGLINFDKKRKEFELLAQIKLLQGSANIYKISEDPMFDRWFASLLILDERQAHQISCQLEPLQETTPKSKSTPGHSSSSSNNNNNGSNYQLPPLQHGPMGHRKSDSIASNSSGGSQFYCDITTMAFSSQNSRNNSLDRDATPPNASILSAGSTTSSLSSSNSTSHKSASISAGGTISAATSFSPAANSRANKSSPSTPIINGQLVQTDEAKANVAPDFYIVKVTYEQTDDVDGVVMYKSMMLGNNERTPQVIRNAMMKLGLETDPDSYFLAQILPEGRELVLPQNANVYYAINTNFDLNFILKPKKK